MDEIVKDFLIESGENLDQFDQELVKLKTEPQSKALPASIFRTIHTIKGSCGFLGFARLEKVTHAGESLLSRLREGQLSLTVEVTGGLLAMVNAVRHMLAEIQATEHDGENDYAELIATLKELQGGAGRQTRDAGPGKTEEGGSSEGKRAGAADARAGPGAPAGASDETKVNTAKPASAQSRKPGAHAGA